jgi:hypothetical protein
MLQIKKVLFIASNIILFTCSVCWAIPTITGITGTVSHGQNLTISGSSFGTKSISTPFKYDNFESGTVNSVFNAIGEESITTSGNRSVNSSYCCARGHQNDGDNDGGIGMGSSSTTDGYYTSFWMKTPSDITWEADGQNKLVRIYTAAPSAPYPNFTLLRNESNSACGTGIELHGSDGGWFEDDEFIATGNWNRIECWFKPSTTLNGSDGIVKVWFNGVLKFSATNWVTSDDGYNSYNGDWRVTNYYWHADKDSYLDEIYFDYTQSRVEIGNNSVFANCTHREIQIPNKWLADGSAIGVTLNLGSFTTEPLYLFVVDSNGVASTGMLLSSSSTPSTNLLSGSVQMSGSVRIQ